MERGSLSQWKEMIVDLRRLLEEEEEDDSSQGEPFVYSRTKRRPRRWSVLELDLWCHNTIRYRTENVEEDYLPYAIRLTSNLVHSTHIPPRILFHTHHILEFSYQRLTDVQCEIRIAIMIIMSLCVPILRQDILPWFNAVHRDLYGEGPQVVEGSQMRFYSAWFKGCYCVFLVVC